MQTYTQTWCNQGKVCLLLGILQPGGQTPSRTASFRRLGKVIYPSDAPSFVIWLASFSLLACTVVQSSAYFFRTGTICQTIRLGWEQSNKSKPGKAQNRREMQIVEFFHPVGVLSPKSFSCHHLKIWWVCMCRHKLQGEAFFRVLGPCRRQSAGAKALT